MKIFVKMINHLTFNIDREKLLFDIGNYNMFDNNCIVHICHTLKLFEKKYNFLTSKQTLVVSEFYSVQPFGYAGNKGNPCNPDRPIMSYLIL